MNRTRPAPTPCPKLEVPGLKGEKGLQDKVRHVKREEEVQRLVGFPSAGDRGREYCLEHIRLPARACDDALYCRQSAHTRTGEAHALSKGQCVAVWGQHTPPSNQRLTDRPRTGNEQPPVGLCQRH